jgi:hypothetical protein
VKQRDTYWTETENNVSFNFFVTKSIFYGFLCLFVIFESDPAGPGRI